MLLLHIILVTITSRCVWCDTSAWDWGSVNLPEEHIPYYFTNNPDIRQRCEGDVTCPYKAALTKHKCWGYEDECPQENRMLVPECLGEHRNWVKTKDAQKDKFWTSGDFGYIRDRRQELKQLCVPEHEGDSSLECVSYTRFCRAKNIYMDFSTADMSGSNDRLREDVFKHGQIGGRCKLDHAALKAESEHKSPLQSWYAEMENYSSLDFHPINDQKCDVIIDKPTILIKLDAGVNMYHHFCDFINIYVSQHLNNSFSTDIYIIDWATGRLGYGDLFKDTWSVFSDHPVIPLNTYDGKRLCFREAVFSFLPRMRYGLYYNMPLVPGCEKTGLVRAFSQHVMHRLRIAQHGPSKDKIRVTLAPRYSKFRNIMNEEELTGAMKMVGEFDVTIANYSFRHMSFTEQLKITHNSDIFICMHGAGLTHMLFLPDWAVVIELYNCEDVNCYLDLARLRGVKYMTWEKKEKLRQQDEGAHPQTGKAHAKFTNYGFEVNEYMRLLYNAADHVRNHPSFIEQRTQKYGQVKDEL